MGPTSFLSLRASLKCCNGLWSRLEPRRIAKDWLIGLPWNFRYKLRIRCATSPNIFILLAILLRARLKSALQAITTLAWMYAAVASSQLSPHYGQCNNRLGQWGLRDGWGVWIASCISSSLLTRLKPHWGGLLLHQGMATCEPGLHTWQDWERWCGPIQGDLGGSPQCYTGGCLQLVPALWIHSLSIVCSCPHVLMDKKMILLWFYIDYACMSW